VGADRGLKRLALVRVGAIELAPAATVRSGTAAADARREATDGAMPYLLLVDEADRPLEWLRVDALPAEGSVQAADGLPAAPIFDRYTTLKDALSMLLEAGVQSGIVVNSEGAADGLVTVDMIIERVRQQ
jgi:osmoprotectant transport system ATP-binding protein